VEILRKLTTALVREGDPCALFAALTAELLEVRGGEVLELIHIQIDVKPALCWDIAVDCRFEGVSCVVEISLLMMWALETVADRVEEVMRYALLIYATPSAGASTPAETRAAHAAADDGVFDSWVAYTRALKDAGALVALQRLQPDETATSVRVRAGERLLTDGPFIETKEQLLGFYLVDAPDLDTALDWAARMPTAREGAVEVRPIYPVPQLTQIVEE
jgi:hypothetical protein